MDVGRDLAEPGGVVQAGDLQPAAGARVREREGVEVLVRHGGPGGGGHPLWIPDGAGRLQETPAHQGLVPGQNAVTGKKKLKRNNLRKKVAVNCVKKKEFVGGK